MADAGCQCVYVVDSAGAMILDEAADRVAAVVAETRRRRPGRLPRPREPRARRRQHDRRDPRRRHAGRRLHPPFGAGAGNTPHRGLVAVCDRLGIRTGIDVLRMIDVAEDVVRPVMDDECSSTAWR